MRSRYLIALLTVIACMSFSLFLSAQAPAPEKVLGNGWQCLLVATSFDGPGTIFSVDGSGAKSRIIDLSQKRKGETVIRVETKPASIPVITSERKVNASIAVSLMEKIAPGLAAKLSAKGQHLDVSKVEYKEVQEETTFETDLKPVVNGWLAKNGKTYTPAAAGTHYFIVRDAYLAGLVDYHFSKENVAELGGEANFKSLFSARADLSGSFQNGYDLNQKFKQPMRVCIRTYEIAPSAGLSGAEVPQIVPEDGEVPEITKVKQ